MITNEYDTWTPCFSCRGCTLSFIHADVGNLPFERSFTDDFVACLDLKGLFVCNEEIHKK